MIYIKQYRPSCNQHDFNRLEYRLILKSTIIKSLSLYLNIYIKIENNGYEMMKTYTVFGITRPDCHEHDT